MVMHCCSSMVRSPFRSLQLFGSRDCSSYVSRMRYLMRLKEDDEACRTALQSGNVLLYHKLEPLLAQTQKGMYHLHMLQATDVKGILGKLGKDEQLLNTSVLIGCSDNDAAQFSLDVGSLEKAAVEEMCGGVFVDLRKAFFLLKEKDTPLVTKGQALLRWHQTHAYCSATGEPTQRNQAGSQRVSPTNGATYYPQMAPVVIVLVSDGKRCLLARQSTFPEGMYSALAGFCDMGETIEETLRREVAEEVGLEVESLQYSSSQHWPFPQSSFMVACHATVSSDNAEVNLNGVELEDARWFTLEEIEDALKKKAFPQGAKGEPTAIWVPPRYAIANKLIREWAIQQKKS
ncbi:nucleoside diphosphate-linked moiety X motif 13 [Anguilla anguilla]|uniref:nucleoside diphosphate-linked moiety X motif 13 n=1 Tax=Anguilla anguilla TaxID=7936 RepID=UPI0015AE4DAA|nr:nucleoside diphosphate-linked moiety X motif 13 [Anguilla anguilla]XP_035257449.1 nucleoside diphosphate-linked moiety X motif 13 [Anguilla anguilla]XP_035257456.1 nucleoside diphosphate-linked moiety X motif 13 [Anguilla anguilla]XP_035257465.1 nucleoside diphosphate-linked moiety X motif 13 [Anguilla anguilla]XP_035257474.1 nucleoside diphosphate-linked moiety X motif 13 [Anguilla anguilla]